ncbi:MAG: glycosyltransferase family 4 protein [Paludibacter sp.]|nr:glycosyltransferase family 4 protein [Paludibacter sp.]
MKKKILISITSQFGYHTDTYMYCKYLDKSKYEVHYIGFDAGHKRRELEGVNIHYIPVAYNKLKRYWIYLSTINKLIRLENFDLLFLVDCQGSLLIRLSNLFRKTIMDVRTGDVRLGTKPFSVFNLKIKLSSLFFKRVSVISCSLSKLLNLTEEKCHILPLGAEEMLLPTKSFEKLQLFYIGTLQGRNITETINGLSVFLKRNKDVQIEYHIVGFGSKEVETELLDSIDHFQLKDIVTFHGRKNHDEVAFLFEKCNIGVVYIPIVGGYTCQPTTKLYEYLLAGMPVIATRTLENELALQNIAGELIEDNAESFAQGLESLLKRKDSLNSEEIKQIYKENTWKNIVKNNLEPYIDKICQ